MHSFVALDVELTPSPGDQQRIIEVAAARYRDGTVTDTFSTLVNPGCRLDPRVRALTGIRQSQLATAPPIGEVARELLSFVGTDPVVGQSIHFDIEALGNWGIALSNPNYDTFELASLLLPGLASYDLAAIGRALGVEPEREHRALEDALVSGRVFIALVARVRELSLEVLTRVSAVSARLEDWALAPIFSEALRDRLRTRFTGRQGSVDASTDDATNGIRPCRPSARNLAERSEASPSDSVSLSLSHGDPSLRSGGFPSDSFSPGRPTEVLRFAQEGTGGALRPEEHTIPVLPDEMQALMRPGGPVATALETFEERPEQIRMLRAVAGALSDGGHLLVEAGTGTGKSLAYLLPSIYFAARNGRHVVISTNTLNLQDQLYQKDIPALQKSLPVPFKAAVLKGRANYLCLRRWTVLSRTADLSREESLLLIRTLIWLSTTATGDRAELNLSPAETALWSRISAQIESCALHRCPHFRRGECFVVRARKDAENAHVIVVNHALLLSDLATSRVLPEYSHVVIDEAHHLEEEATEQLGFTFGWGDLSSFLASLYQLDLGHRPAGFLIDLEGKVAASDVPREVASAIAASCRPAAEAVGTALAEGRSFFDSLSCFLHDHAEDRRGTETRLRLTRSSRSQPGWAEVEVRGSELTSRLRAVEGHLGRVQSDLERLEGDALPERDGIIADFDGFRAYLQTLALQAQEMISEPSSNGIYWISGGTTLEDLAVHSAPLHVGELLNDILFKSKDSVVLTSATLTAEGGFEYIRERLSLDDASELMLGSPFDYRKSTLLYVVQDIPEPGRPSYQRAVESAISDLVLAMEGRTLVLFTSHAQLRMTSSAIRSRLEHAGILVLAHGLDGSRRKLLQAFKTAGKAVLLGTSSFWEGIDVVGDALSCVVIVKLPFAVPTDPIFAARSESFDEPFRQYSVPQTILKFKQGFGRLIRGASDRGVVVILDSRLKSKFYGPAFLQSLPACTTRTGAAANAFIAARDWLRG